MALDGQIHTQVRRRLFGVDATGGLWDRFVAVKTFLAKRKWYNARDDRSDMQQLWIEAADLCGCRKGHEGEGCRVGTDAQLGDFLAGRGEFEGYLAEPGPETAGGGPSAAPEGESADRASGSSGPVGDGDRGGSVSGLQVPAPSPRKHVRPADFVDRPPSTVGADIDWVYGHIAFAAADLHVEDCPSAGAWRLLGWSRANEAKFFEMVFRRHSKVESAKGDPLADDGEAIELLDRIEREAKEAEAEEGG